MVVGPPIFLARGLRIARPRAEIIGPLVQRILNAKNLLLLATIARPALVVKPCMVVPICMMPLVLLVPFVTTLTELTLTHAMGDGKRTRIAPANFVLTCRGWTLVGALGAACVAIPIVATVVMTRVRQTRLSPTPSSPRN